MFNWMGFVHFLAENFVARLLLSNSEGKFQDISTPYLLGEYGSITYCKWFVYKWKAGRLCYKGKNQTKHNLKHRQLAFLQIEKAS